MVTANELYDRLAVRERKVSGTGSGRSTKNRTQCHVHAGALILGLTLLVGHPGNVLAEETRASDPNLSNPTAVVTAKRDGYTVSGLVTHLEGVKSFKHGLALFPGSPGILKLQLEEGRPKFTLSGNFLVRTRRHWLDAETLVVVVDAPSDQWATFYQHFRETPRYGADVAALLKEVERLYPVGDWTFVGTSEGSVSAYHAARLNPALARRTILTSSLFSPGKNGPGLSGINWNEVPKDLLWVHHEDDPCSYTSYRDAKRYSQKSGKPLVTVHGGGPGRGPSCEAYSSHGYAGIERETVLAMRSWIKTGAVPADVKPK